MMNLTSEHLANHVADKQNADIILYNGPLERPMDRDFIEACLTRKRRKNVILILVSGGGNLDAAYRIARCLQSNYDEFSLLVSGYCKSAGTLVAVGASELIISSHGELGPLDVQIRKKDELLNRQSGLVVEAALEKLRDESFEIFKRISLDLHAESDGAITLSTASDIGVKLASELVGRLYNQIDPLAIGEHARSNRIAIRYGVDLNYFGKNTPRPAVERLVSDYPSHGYVIDFEEAETLFHRVRRPTVEEQELIDALGDRGYDEGVSEDDKPEFKFLCSEPQKQAREDNDEINEGDAAVA